MNPALVIDSVYLLCGLDKRVTTSDDERTPACHAIGFCSTPEGLVVSHVDAVAALEWSLHRRRRGRSVDSPDRHGNGLFVSIGHGATQGLDLDDQTLALLNLLSHEIERLLEDDALAPSLALEAGNEVGQAIEAVADRLSTFLLRRDVIDLTLLFGQSRLLTIFVATGTVGGGRFGLGWTVVATAVAAAAAAAAAAVAVAAAAPPAAVGRCG